MKNTVFIVTALVCVSGLASAGEFKIDREFLEYIKKATNPHELGLRKDGLFYPYSTRYGRRVGYRQKVTDKRIYSQGISKKAAEIQLEKDLQEALAMLQEHVNRNYPETPFDSLSHKSQFILLDFAYSQGAENISPEFYQTVIAQDWGKLIHSYMYIRMTDGWPDQIQNKAFADKWIYTVKSGK